jgi:hypothetical protein
MEEFPLNPSAQFQKQHVVSGNPIFEVTIDNVIMQRSQHISK